MGTRRIRQETTDYCDEKIRSFLAEPDPDYTSAILLAFIYVNTRLRTILTNYLSPTEERWEDLHNSLNYYSVKGLLTVCNKFGLLASFDPKMIRKLRDLDEKRNDVAHESRLWRGIANEEEANKIKELCNAAQEFLRNTTQ
jgi:hypothetical protein